MHDLDSATIDTLVTRIGRRLPLIDEMGELLDTLADRIDDYGEHRVAEVMRSQADEFREHARRLEILTREKDLGK